MFIKKLTKQVICDPDDPVVSAPDGRLRGVIADDTYIFRGIRYATAKRFRMPVAEKPWEGVKDAIIYGPVCPELQTVQPDDNYTVPHVFYPQDEDCLYLNIWTQRINAPLARRPVLVWFHGGGYSTGSGIEHFAYDGENMSRFGDVVVITLNHRLNVLGYLDLSDYGEEYRYSGNLGNADLVEALRWVKRNIAAFGGDPDNVTIFGQSGGGGKVAALLQTPSADGLFHRAVIESGLGWDRKPRPNEKDRSAEKLLAALGLDAGRVKELETIPYWKLQKAYVTMGRELGLSFRPHRDDDFYLGDIFEVGICEHAKTIPVMVGNVLGEFGQNFVLTADDGRKNEWSEEKSMSILREKFGDACEEAVRLHRKAYPDLPISNLLFLDRMFRGGTFRYLKLRAETGLNNTYGFMFRMEMPVYGGTLPWHNSEIPYVFHNADYLEPSYVPGVTEKLQDLMCGAWCRFAETGDPNVTGLPAWGPYVKGDQEMMYFDENSYAKPSDDEEALFEFLSEHPIEMERITRQKRAKFFAGGPRV